MLGLGLDLDAGRPLKLLCLGAHADDIEIGAGGTVLHLLRRYPGADIRWVIFTASGERRQEARASADAFLEGAGSHELTLFEFRDGFLPYEPIAVKEAMRSVAQSFTPDLVLTHRSVGDGHQDHRFVGELTWMCFRNQVILEYEIPKWEGDLVPTNFYVPIEAALAEHKVALLDRCFASQRGHDWFKRENFLAVMRLRGLECRAADGFAEGFHARKLRGLA